MEIYVLGVQYPDGRQERRELGPGRYRIGREAGEIKLGDPQVSSSHAELTLGEIAWKLGYSSTAHLSAQFKKMTGLTPSHFKKTGNSRRTSLDKIL